MKIEIILIFLATILLTYSCSLLEGNKDYVRKINRAQRAANASLKQQGYKRCATGGSCYGDLRLYAEDYDAYHDQFATIDEARLFIVEKAEAYMKVVNEDKEVRPYLHNYPFTARNLQLSFYFRDKNYKLISESYISSVRVNTGRVFYERRNPGEDWGRTIHTESYEQALALYKEHLKKMEMQK